jgi:transcriptional antiterminator Rof (Rho-off)
MTTSPYVPIDCDQHSALEVLAMRRTAVSLQAVDDAGVEILLQGRVRDLVTRAGAEFLVLEDEERCRYSIRLDHLRALYDRSGALIWRQKIVGGAHGGTTD